MAKKKVTRINPRRFYTLGEIVRLGLIDGATTVPIISRLVRSDLILPVDQRVLNAARVPRGVNGVQYQVQGRNIIKFLANLDDAKRNN